MKDKTYLSDKDLDDRFRDSTDHSVWISVKNSIRNSVEDSDLNSVENLDWYSVTHSIYYPVIDLVNDLVTISIGATIASSLDKSR